MPPSVLTIGSTATANSSSKIFEGSSKAKERTRSKTLSLTLGRVLHLRAFASKFNLSEFVTNTLFLSIV